MTVIVEEPLTSFLQQCRTLYLYRILCNETVTAPNKASSFFPSCASLVEIRSCVNDIFLLPRMIINAFIDSARGSLAEQLLLAYSV